MFLLKFSIALILLSHGAVDGKSLSFSQKELKSLGEVFKSVLDRHFTDKGHRVSGSFSIHENIENPEESDISVDIDVQDSKTHNGLFSGKLISISGPELSSINIFTGNDILNGLANGNGNDNGNNGQIFLQIFNGKVEGEVPKFTTASTEPTESTQTWYTTQAWGNNNIEE